MRNKSHNNPQVREDNRRREKLAKLTEVNLTNWEADGRVVRSATTCTWLMLLTYDLVALAAEPARSWKTFWLVGQEYTGWMVALEEVRMPSSSQLVS
jgi:hypothetical protein